MILQKLLSGPGRIITHLLVWLLVATVMFYLLSTMRPAGEAAGRTMVNLFFPAVIFYLNGKVLVNRFFETKRYWTWGFWSIVLWLGMAFIRTKAEFKLFGGSVFTNNIRPQDGGWKMFLVVALIFFILMVFSGLYQLLENRRELESLHTQAQLNYLKAQINPHFLFNTLNNIYSAATLQHPRTADMVLRLSDLLRYVTYDAQAERVPLQLEIAHIRAYLELFELKSAAPLPIRFDLEGDLESREIEPLLLLPLVENALKHSDLELNPKAYLHISLKNSPKALLFQVENTFDAENKQKDDVGGVGLMNVRRRLAIHHADQHRFTTQSDDAVFKAELEITYPTP